MHTSTQPSPVSYGVAAETCAHALAIFTVSDHLRTGEATSSAERQTTFADMIEIALHAATGTYPASEPLAA